MSAGEEGRNTLVAMHSRSLGISREKRRSCVRAIVRHDLPYLGSIEMADET